MKQALAAVVGVLMIAQLYYGKDFLPARGELTDTSPAIVFGVDRDGGEVEVTLVLHNAEQGGEGKMKPEDGDDGGEENNAVISARAPTAAAALQKIRRRCAKSVTTGAVAFFIIGEKAAEELHALAGFLVRDNSFSLTSQVFIAKDGARELLGGADPESWIGGLDIYGEDSGNAAISSPYRLLELLRDLSGGGDFTVPVLLKGQEKDGILPDGYAVIKNGGPAGYIGREAARGYHLLTGKPVESVLDIQLPAGTAALRVEKARVSCDFNFSDAALTGIHAVVRVTVGAEETPAGPAGLEKAAAGVLREEIERVLALREQWGSDFLGLSGRLRMRHPVRWERMADRERIIAETPVTVEIICTVR
ncbi:MAG: hypothetical protein FWE80_06505 [Oscillospiraceae bacterium]|nr:hypothetical protein [Oscillospiraceae bacterium]